MSESSRADKWLWATRFFKTRGIAAEFCEQGKVKRNGHVIKPASSIQMGDLLEVPFPEGPGIKQILVTGLIEKRVGAPQARACYDEKTPSTVYESNQEWFSARRLSGVGRPTKRNRREIDRIRGFWDAN